MERRDSDAARTTIETVKGDTHDALDGAAERVKAVGEKANRALQGDAMPLGDRLASHVKEMGHDVKADYDKNKPDLRDEGI